MAFVIDVPAQPVIIEQAPPPVVFQAPPPPVIIEQAPPPVVFQAAPPQVVIEQAPPPVVVQGPTSVGKISAQFQYMMHAPMKSLPVSMTCGYCKQKIVTSTKAVSGLLTWAVFGTLLFFCIWPFCLIPFCVESCKDIEHSCPNCHNVLKVYKRI
ncbi:hypothetical protein Q7C36_022172 [Tachysurus vachellii]|uniref:LITAF domain-containing protein n=1 Tax=Tachysurus vachellii TaxID=175792 RepID=A0AA88IRD5_TACVA|nr:hypothetical protein Q7C36_022172 [Tachysurus vachellii]